MDPEVSNSESQGRVAAFEYPFLISKSLGQPTCMQIIAFHSTYNSLAYANYHWKSHNFPKIMQKGFYWFLRQELEAERRIVPSVQAPYGIFHTA